MLYEVITHDFGFTDQKTIKECGNRFRIDKTGDPAGQQQGIMVCSVLASCGQADNVKNRQDMGVIIFKGDSRSN